MVSEFLRFGISFVSNPYPVDEESGSLHAEDDSNKLFSSIALRFNVYTANSVTVPSMRAKKKPLVTG